MESEMSDWKGQPNPGSNNALDRGCTCAVMDNNRGRWAPHPPNDWWITVGCPVHDPTDNVKAVRALIDEHREVFDTLKDS
jgi:hypothetical protein